MCIPIHGKTKYPILKNISLALAFTTIAYHYKHNLMLLSPDLTVNDILTIISPVVIVSYISVAYINALFSMSETSGTQAISRNNNPNAISNSSDEHQINAINEQEIECSLLSLKDMLQENTIKPKIATTDSSSLLQLPIH